MTPIVPAPDALLVPAKLKRGRTLFERMCSILDLAEPMLRVDRSKGERAYIREQPQGWLFITKDQFDTIYHPLRTPMQGRPRYTWLDGQDGIRRGYVTEAARRVMIDAEREG
jgi:hypothetical protein